MVADKLPFGSCRLEEVFLGHIQFNSIGVVRLREKKCFFDSIKHGFRTFGRRDGQYDNKEQLVAHVLNIRI